MRQRFLPFTAGERQLAPLRVFAPHRGLINMGDVLRLWVPGISAKAIFRLTAWWGQSSWQPRAPSRAVGSIEPYLPARFDVDIPDVHTAGTTAPNTLERINELRNHGRALERVPEVNVPML
jgi:hypothetical protein